MSLLALIEKPHYASSEKLNNNFKHLQSLIREANKHTLAEKITQKINSLIQEINDSTLQDEALAKALKAQDRKIIDILAKEAQLTPMNYYSSLWLVLGMASFGLPLGLLLGIYMKNTALFGLGLPIGMAIGAVLGKALDKKAATNGKQLALPLV